jgi:RNase P subunit RPR2
MMSKECEMCEWFVWGGVDIHSISNYENEFEAIVNVEVKCSNCGKIETLVMTATDEV